MTEPTRGRQPLRLLVVCPSWVGDAVMATPALRLLRDRLPGAFIGALVRPGINEVLTGSGLVDEFHVARATGILGPKHVASKIRPRRYDTALLLTNSFSTALIARIAGVPRRIGYDRDGRGFLLTEGLAPKKRDDGRWAIVPAVAYYWRLACALLGEDAAQAEQHTMPRTASLELGFDPDEARRCDRLLEEAGVEPGARFAVLVPGASKPEKRWPTERFAAVGDHLSRAHDLRVLVCGGPSEGALVDEVVQAGEAGPVGLAGGELSLGVLKALIARAALVVSNDTGPRHIAAALGVPCVALFGPTDHRWTTVPCKPGGPQRLVLADPALPEHESANDHPQRCRIDRIEVGLVIDAAEALLSESAQGK